MKTPSPHSWLAHDSAEEVPSQWKRSTLERGGYFFDPVAEVEMARDCCELFTKYAAQAETKKRKK
jgi:hypothetical protein